MSSSMPFLCVGVAHLPGQDAAAAYHDNVLDLYNNLRNDSSSDLNELNVATRISRAPACDDFMKLQIKIDEKGKIFEAKFKSFGCGPAIF